MRIACAPSGPAVTLNRNLLEMHTSRCPSPCSPRRYATPNSRPSASAPRAPTTCVTSVPRSNLMIVGMLMTPYGTLRSLVGSGLGGYLTTEATFGDFELSYEVRPDWPADTGVLVRTTDL